MRVVYFNLHLYNFRQTPTIAHLLLWFYILVISISDVFAQELDKGKLMNL